MRPLTLHVSALSDAEYDLYTVSFDDLSDAVSDINTNTNHHPATTTTDYERTAVGVREARAWLRGRYSDLPATDVDAILKLFCPNMLPSDTLTGGQFFAALRLVMHAKSGKGVDRTLAFIQASPKPTKVTPAADIPRPLSPPKRPVQAPPSHPDRQKLPPSTPSPETNPFTRRSMEHADPAEPVTTFPPRIGRTSHNPFLAADRADSGPDKAVPSHAKLPPLPPRKPAALQRRPSEATTQPTAPSGLPLIPVKPTHVMSPLMRQSLEASKHAQSLKRVEEQLDRERVLQVLKTTSSSSSSAGNNTSTRPRSLSPSKPSNGHTTDTTSDDATHIPPLPGRRKPSLHSSTASSVLSLDQVANAKLPTPARPPLPSRDTPALAISTDYAGHPAVPGPIPPPTHPHRRSSSPTVNDSQSSSPSSPRVARSKSVTSSSSSVPPPPPRRKRPESMQLITSDAVDLPAFPPVLSAHTHTQMHARAASFQGLSRHLSFSRERERERDPSDSSTMSNIQKTLTNLQLKAQPKLDAVRYKAEAGISKRGYVHHVPFGRLRWREEGEQGLMADTRWAAANVDRDPDSEPTTDDEPSCEEHNGRTRPNRDFLTGSDNLKWPMGEGWKPL